jgi:hypothetical protein
MLQDAVRYRKKTIVREMSPLTKLPDRTAALHTTPALQANIPKPKFHISAIPPAPPKPPTQTLIVQQSPNKQTSLNPFTSQSHKPKEKEAKAVPRQL